MFDKLRIIIVFFIISNLAFSEDSEEYIRAIQLVGNKNVSIDQILPLIRQKPPSFIIRRPIFDSRLLKLDALTLKSFYHSKGFLDAKIQESYIKENNYINIKYIIVEGKKYCLSDVKIIGNSKVEDSKIKSLLGLNIKEAYDPV